MSRLRRFLSLPAGDRRLFVRALLSLWAVRVGLWVLPFGRLRRSVARASRRHLRAGASSAERVAWAVGSASRFVPDATCLVKALSAKVLLGRAGVPAELRIGVARAEGERLRAHAWVECDGRVVVGDHDLSRFTPLPSIDGEST